MNAASEERPPPADVRRNTRGTTPAATAYLDTLRFVAANLVMLSHILLVFFDNQVTYKGRGVAVIILFLLSGFLITQSLLYRAKKPGTHLPSFMADRVARILTPFVPVLLAIALLNATVIDTRMSGDGLSTGVAALVGNLLLLFDYPVFQMLEVAGIHVPWRIRPYNTAEPFWTVAIEFWLYVAASLLVFCVLLREKLKRPWVLLLAAVSLPVVIWNAAAGPGKALSLVWVLGGLAGFIVVHMGRDSIAARSRVLWAWIVGIGAVALAGRVAKLGFDPYDLQTAFLMTLIFLGLFLRLNQAATVWRVPAACASFFASYSYSLYLVHNTVLVLVWELTRDALPRAASIAVAVALAHLCGYLVYLGFEKHHRAVGSRLRPLFERWLVRPEARVPVAERPHTPLPAAP